jgi:hypothetical protein
MVEDRIERRLGCECEILKWSNKKTTRQWSTAGGPEFWIAC